MARVGSPILNPISAKCCSWHPHPTLEQTEQGRDARCVFRQASPSGCAQTWGESRPLLTHLSCSCLCAHAPPLVERWAVSSIHILFSRTLPFQSYAYCVSVEYKFWKWERWSCGCLVLLNKHRVSSHLFPMVIFFLPQQVGERLNTFSWLLPSVVWIVSKSLI